MSAEATPCRSCGTPVIFAEHDRTKRRAPLEHDPAGKWTIVWPSYFLATPGVPAAHRFTNHFARCSNPERHRGAS